MHKMVEYGFLRPPTSLLNLNIFNSPPRAFSGVLLQTLSHLTTTQTSSLSYKGSFLQWL